MIIVKRVYDVNQNIYLIRFNELIFTLSKGIIILLQAGHASSVVLVLSI